MYYYKKTSFSFTYWSHIYGRCMKVFHLVKVKVQSCVCRKQGLSIRRLQLELFACQNGGITQNLYWSKE